MEQRLPTTQFEAMREELESSEQQRDELIKRGRDLLRDAKRVIYLTHEGEHEQAESLLEKLRSSHEGIRSDYPDCDSVSPYSDSVEEYVEAACFLRFEQASPVPERKELQVSVEQYLGGLADATGEMGRRAVFAATEGDRQRVEEILGFVKAFQGEMLRFHLRNGNLRKKYDSLKYTLKKLEEIRYELGIRS